MAENTLYFGDNLKILSHRTVDLIYPDALYNSKANYDVLFRSPKGSESHAQIIDCLTFLRYVAGVDG